MGEKKTFLKELWRRCDYMMWWHKQQGCQKRPLEEGSTCLSGLQSMTSFREGPFHGEVWAKAKVCSAISAWRVGMWGRWAEMRLWRGWWASAHLSHPLSLYQVPIQLCQATCPKMVVSLFWVLQRNRTTRISIVVWCGVVWCGVFIVLLHHIILH